MFLKFTFKTSNKPTNLCISHSHFFAGEKDLHMDKNLAVHDDFKLEVENVMGSSLLKVTADHFKIPKATTYVVKAKFGSQKSVRSLTVHYYGQCNFLSLSNKSISEECLKYAKNVKSKAIECIMKKAKRSVSYSTCNLSFTLVFGGMYNNLMYMCML